MPETNKLLTNTIHSLREISSLEGISRNRKMAILMIIQQSCSELLLNLFEKCDCND